MSIDKPVLDFDPKYNYSQRYINALLNETLNISGDTDFFKGDRIISSDDVYGNMQIVNSYRKAGHKLSGNYILAEYIEAGKKWLNELRTRAVLADVAIFACPELRYEIEISCI